MWAGMRMSPTDIMDVNGSTYTFLVNGQPPAANWTGLFHPGERVRLRLINAAAMSTFDVRIPGLKLRVVAADGGDVQPLDVDELRIGVAETYDVIVEPGEQAYTLFAQAQDRSGFARATLAPRPGMTAPVPTLDPRPLRTMADMDMSAMAGMQGMAGHSMMGMDMSKPGAMAGMGRNADGVDPARLRGAPEVDNIDSSPVSRVGEAGDGLDHDGRKALTYADLKALRPAARPDPVDREIEFHLTGNMQRWIWGFDGKKFSEAPPVPVKLGERVRFILINDTMMEHPIHLHGFLFALENGQDAPPLKHTVTVKPNERLSLVYTADTPGHWAFHCHLMYHMESGMFRTVVVA
jgi:CopA family copper-resistance protein